MGRLGLVSQAFTTTLNINFMRKPEPADLLGEGRLLKLGRTLAVGDFTIWSEGKTEPVAHATVTYSIPPRGKNNEGWGVAETWTNRVGWRWNRHRRRPTRIRPYR